MLITSDDMFTIKRAINYAVSSENEIRKNDEFKNSKGSPGAYISQETDTGIRNAEGVIDEIKGKTEEEIIDNDNLCTVLSSALGYLTNYQPGRTHPNDKEEIIIKINNVKEKFCKKNYSEYY